MTRSVKRSPRSPPGDNGPTVLRAKSAVRHPRGEATRNRILNAAEELFSQKGYHAASLRDIAAAANTELGLTTYYFGSKQRLIEDVLHRRAEISANALTKALDRVEQSSACNDPAAILNAFSETILLPLKRGHRSGINYVRLAVQHAEEIRAALGGKDPIKLYNDPVRIRYISSLERAIPGANPLVVPRCFEVFEGALGRMLFTSLMEIKDLTLLRTRAAEVRRCLLPFCAAGFKAFEA